MKIILFYSREEVYVNDRDYTNDIGIHRDINDLGINQHSLASVRNGDGTYIESIINTQDMDH